jgi:hypothetical protein
LLSWVHVKLATIDNNKKHCQSSNDSLTFES